MRVKCYLLSALLAGGLLASCSDNDEVGNRSVNETGEEASLSIKLVGNDSGTRAIDAGTNESVIDSFAVYVFNSADILDYREVFTVSDAGDLVKTIIGLTTGSKKVVVFANMSTYPAGIVGTTNYATLTADIHLDDQNATGYAGGFVMGGERTVELIKSETPTTLTVPVERAVAKIVIGTITVDKNTAYPAEFEITKVHIMKAMPYAAITPSTVTGKQGEAEGLYGGLSDETYASKISRTYLADDFIVPINDNENNTNTSSGIVFYVFPNEVSGSETLITFEGTYGNDTRYYPFRINEHATNGGNGELIKRNTVHVFDVTFKNVGTGSMNPEIPLDLADLEITVSVVNWSLTLTHNLEW